ncbi:hypothetical protein Tco_0879611 [Tanacetum coccineum]
MVHLTNSRLTRKGSPSIWKVFQRDSPFCPRLLDHEFDEPPSEEEILSFIKRTTWPHLEIFYNITRPWFVDHMHQPGNFCLIITQVLWKLTYVALLWEDFAFQIDNKDVKKQEKMYYPRFTKAIIHHFLSKDKSISMRNIMFMHTTAQDDNILGTLRFVSKDEDTQMSWQTPKPKRIYKKHDSPMIKTTTTSPEETPSKRKSAPAKKDVSSKKPSRKQSTGVQIKDTPVCCCLKKEGTTPTDKSKANKSGDDDDGNDDDSDDVCDDDGNDDDNDNDGNNDASKNEED